MRARPLLLGVPLVVASAVGVVGCSALIGLEDRQLGPDGGRSADGGSGGDATSSGETSVSDAGGKDAAFDADPTPDACKLKGFIVNAYRAGDESWRYDILNGMLPTGFTIDGPVFRLVHPDERVAANFARTIFVRRVKGETMGDHIVTPNQFEGEPAMETVVTLSALYFGNPTQPPGTVEIHLVRRTQTPVRHKLIVGKIIPVGWLVERTFYGCPL